MVDCSPKIMKLAVDPHVDFINMPSPMVEATHPVDTLASDLSSEQRAKSIPPQPDRLMAQLDAAFVQQILDIAQREREPHVQHDHEPDDLGRGAKIAKRGRGLAHPSRLSGS